MISRRNWTPLQWAEYALTRSLGLLPAPLTSSIGAWLGRRHARRGIAARRLWVERLHRNLIHYQGVHDPAEREARIIEHMARVGRVHAEFLVHQKLIAQGRVEVEGTEILAGIDRQVIVVCAHLANWELVGHIMARLGRPVCDIYQPPANPVEHRIATEARLRWPVKTDLLAAGPHTMPQVVRALNRGDNLLLFIDEEKDGYVHAPRLGRDVPWSGNRWFAARLASRYGLDLLPVHVESRGPARYRIIVEPPIPAAGQSPDTLASHLEAPLDRWVRAGLEEWYWLPYFDRARKA
jgi:Kdo2-lipid IVA lauroyltransferase/acyltransferase